MYKFQLISDICLYALIGKLDYVFHVYFCLAHNRYILSW